MSYGTLQIEKMTTESGYSLGAGNASSYKNRIINGACVIDQRAAGASTTPTAAGYYSCDRWYTELSVASKFSIQQNAGAVTPPAGFTNYIGITSTSSYSLVSGDYFYLSQNIEGFNVSDIGWGTANCKSVTVSFWVYSSLTGTFSVSLECSGNNQSYPATYTVNSANTWQLVSVAIPVTASGTWNKTNGVGAKVRWNLGTGSTLSGTANTWSSGRSLAATGATSVVSTNGATFYITGVQLEVGTVATSFDFREYGTELRLCQRYYEQFGNNWWCSGETANYNVVYAGSFLVQKRATPSCSLLYTDLTLYQFGVANRNGSGCSIISQSQMRTYGGQIKVAGWSTITTGQLYGGGGSVSAGYEVQPMAASAEL